MIAPAIAPAIAPEETEARSTEDLLETVSASRLNCFQQCRLKFFFRYVLGIKKTRTAALYVGSIVHSVLQAWSMARWRHQKVDVELLKKQFETTWSSM